MFLILLNMCLENAHSAVQSCLNLCGFVDYSPPGSSAQGIFQVKKKKKNYMDIIPNHEKESKLHQ